MEFLFRDAIPKHDKGNSFAKQPLESALSRDKEKLFYEMYLLYIENPIHKCGFSVVKEHEDTFRTAMLTVGQVAADQFDKMLERAQLNNEFDAQNRKNIKKTIQKQLQTPSQDSLYEPEKSLFKTRVIEPLYLATERFSSYIA